MAPSSTAVASPGLTRPVPPRAVSAPMALTASPPTSLPLTTMSTTPSPGYMATSTPPPAFPVQRPTLVQQKSPLAVVPMNGGMSSQAHVPALSTGPLTEPVKPEPAVPPTTSTPPPAGSTTASPSASGMKNEQLEKIQFAKKLLFHASTCALPPGVCQVKKCDDVRRVFKHSVSCGGAGSCSHCEQLKGLVKYHVKECVAGANEHCAIPFCDGLRRAHLAATAAALAAKAKTSLPSTTNSSAVSKFGATSDDDDDNTPLSSAVSKAKKNSAKAKSPKASPTVRPTTASPAASTAPTSKKKSTLASKPTTPAMTTATSTTGSATAGAASKQAAAAAAKPAANMNMTVEYGRLLQLILHVQKCTVTECPVGEECTEAKMLMSQVNSPNAPVRGVDERTHFD